MTTMESSITRPMAMVSPPSVSMLRDSPRDHRMMSAPTTLSGIERPAMTVDRQLRRNTQMTMTAKIAPRRPSRTRVRMLSLMKTDWSTTVVIVVSPPRSRVSAGSSSATALAMSTVLPLLALLTEMPTEASPLVRVMAVSGAGAILTSATSPRLMGCRLLAAPAEPAAAAAMRVGLGRDGRSAGRRGSRARGRRALEGASTSCSSAFSVSALALTVMG